MDRGYLWFALNNSTTDYIELSRALAKSIKKFNRHNKDCVITDMPIQDELFDYVRVLKNDDSKDQEYKDRIVTHATCLEFETFPIQGLPAKPTGLGA